MAKPLTKKFAGIRTKQLHYGDIVLVPVIAGVHPYFDHEKFDNSWHLPGHRIATTAQLVKLANSRGITVLLSESSFGDVVRTQLTEQRKSKHETRISK